MIIYAGSLVNPELLDYARESCEIYNSAKMTLDEVIAVMKAAEADGKITVRLHTGNQAYTAQCASRWMSLILF